MDIGTTFFGVSLWSAALVAGALIAVLWGIMSLLLHTHERIRCPVRGRMARVTLLRAPNGTVHDVVRCSLLGRGPVTCDKRCLRLVHA
jgi:hypothetical protein